MSIKKVIVVVINKILEVLRFLAKMRKGGFEPPTSRFPAVFTKIRLSAVRYTRLSHWRDFLAHRSPLSQATLAQ